MFLVEFELPSLKTGESPNANWVLDLAMLCREKGASVDDKVGLFELVVLAAHNLGGAAGIFCRVFKSGKALI